MMNAFLVAAAVVQAGGAGAGQDSGKLSAGQLVSKMFANYYEAKTLTANIEYSILISGQTVVVNTTLQYQRPNLLYIKQTKTGSGLVPMAVCDGKYIAYTRPFDDSLKASEDRVFGELALNPDFTEMSVADAYTAMSKSLYDRSTASDILIANPLDLQFVKDQWATFVDEGTVDFGGVKARKITGEWRPYRLSPQGQPAKIEGKYDMLISEDKAELLQFRMLEVNINEGTGQVTTGSLNTWTIKATINGKVDEKLFDSRLVKG